MHRGIIKNNMTYYIYILTTKNNKIPYVGITDDLKRRLYEHITEKNESFTKKFHMKKLIYYESYSDPYSAILREKQLKRWRNDKKFALAKTKNPELDDLGRKLFPGLFELIKKQPLK